jgi:hypothetical protein
MGASLREQGQRVDECNKRMKKINIKGAEQEKIEVLVEDSTETVDLKQWLVKDMQVDVDDPTWCYKLYHNCILLPD